jgi:hypothetical protein
MEYAFNRGTQQLMDAVAKVDVFYRVSSILDDVLR